MLSPAAKSATVLHLATGHVLAAISAASGPEPKIDITEGAHVRVRLPATTGFVNVPTSKLKTTRIVVDENNADVLDRPQHYDLLAGTPPPLGLRGPPQVDAFEAEKQYANAKAILVWQVGDVPVFDEITLTATGGVPATPPDGLKYALLAIDGGPLYLASTSDPFGESD